MYIYFYLVYYRTKEECQKDKQFFSELSFKEIAILYKYVEICLEILTQRNTFNNNKFNPSPFFLSSLLRYLPNCLEQKQKN